ncbi:uncharacterized protein At3g17950-like [Panicum virgatum]|uniref:uncharacterized protein At3g17950-like n=1 Tax=Panicum virgatum TaxID=38727 RepID=UPI0019D60437|nr:uncharacterized protein At3g17950-like [Panicum virgatum]
MGRQPRLPFLVASSSRRRLPARRRLPLSPWPPTSTLPTSRPPSLLCAMNSSRRRRRRGAQRAPREEEEERRRGGVWRRRRRRRRRRGRSLGGSWWRLCRDHGDGGPLMLLGEFLDMERQLAGADFLCDGAGASGREAAVAAATALFEDGRLRPPQPAAAAAAEERGRWRLLRASEGSSSLARLPVLLTGICSGGAG